MFAQRQNVNSLNAIDRVNLSSRIKNLLDNYHEDLIHRHTATTIHTTNNFFVWHKFYIHKMEKYLHSNFNASLFESNPLPYWDPLTPISGEFFLPGSAGCVPTIPNPVPNFYPNPCPLGWIPPTPIVCNVPVNDRTNDISDNTSPGHCAAGHIHEEHAAVYLPLQFNDINTVAGGLNGRFNSTFSGITTKQFYTNVAGSTTYTCGIASTRNALTNFIGPGAGHHGNVHLAIGGCLGGNFHQAPGSTLFSIWHSYLDKVWHDWEVNCGQISGPDLYIADRENDDDMTSTTHNGIDMGYEPNEAPATYPMWVSEDIWVRNQQDGIQYQEHENPEYETGKKVYVYVRVRNRGGAISSGNEQVNLYWAKANTSLDYPSAWNGSNVLCTNPAGGQIATSQTVTPLQPDGYKIYMFEFNLPKPSDYSCVGDINHFCLLARITDSSKPNEGMTFAETNDIYSNVRNNNNIAWKNISILDDLPNMNVMSATIRVLRSNLCKDGDCVNKIIFKLPFVLPKHRESANILDYTKIAIKLNPQLLEAFRSTKTKIYGAEMDKRGVLNISKDNVEIPVFLKKGVENYTFQVNVVKPRKLPKYLPELKFDIIQMNEKKVIGGQRFVIPVNKFRTIRDMKKK